MKKAFFLFCIILIGFQCRTKKQVVAEEEMGTEQLFIGEFMYFADAPVFRHCGNPKSIPVVRDKAYIDVERQYMKQTEGGTWVYIEFFGDIVQKKNEEGRWVSMYLIGRLEILDKSKSCP